GNKEFQYYKRRNKGNMDDGAFIVDQVRFLQELMQGCGLELQKTMSEQMTKLIIEALGNGKMPDSNGEGSSHSGEKNSSRPTPKFFKGTFLPRENHRGVEEPSMVETIEACNKEYDTLHPATRAMLTFDEFCALKMGNKTKRAHKQPHMDVQQRLGKVSLPSFDGTNKITVRAWLQKMETYFSLNHIQEEEALKFVTLHLEGMAHE
ncbi:hypothetical protein KI387_016389, partial [Taxus chinensis]